MAHHHQQQQQQIRIRSQDTTNSYQRHVFVIIFSAHSYCYVRNSFIDCGRCCFCCCCFNLLRFLFHFYLFLSLHYYSAFDLVAATIVASISKTNYSFRLCLCYLSDKRSLFTNESKKHRIRRGRNHVHSTRNNVLHMIKLSFFSFHTNAMNLNRKMCSITMTRQNELLENMGTEWLRLDFENKLLFRTVFITPKCILCETQNKCTKQATACLPATVK